MINDNVENLIQAIKDLEKKDYDQKLMRELQQGHLELEESEEDLKYWMELCTLDYCLHLKARYYDRMSKI